MANNIRGLLDQKGWSIYKLHKVTGLTYATAHRLVAADDIPPNTKYETLLRIATALGVGIEELED